MAYGPQVVMRKEGLGRYIGNLISGFVAAGHKITVACPKWSLDTIDDLFQDFQINEDMVEFIVSRKVPVLWYFYDRKKKKRYPKRSLRYRAMTSAADVMDAAISRMISITSMTLFLLLIPLGVLAGILLLPFALVGAVLYLIYKLVKFLLKKGTFSIKEIIFKLISLTVEYSSEKWTDIHAFLVERRDSIVHRELVKRVNRSEKEAVWFVPALFWPQIEGIKGVKVVCAPDLVTEHFPDMFAGTRDGVEATDMCRKVLANEKYFITYCSFIRRTLLLDRFGKDGENVVAIPHINNSMSEYITLPASWSKLLNSHKDFTLSFAKACLREIRLFHRNADWRYTESFDIDGIRFIFYASQYRPYKNMLNLVKAYEYLLREKYVNFKLVMTCDLNKTDVLDYILEHRLQYDVLCFHNVTAQQLAALYRCADLVVTPTLYEGGFPFTFGEGMSVGTPSVMSDIPQARDVVEPYGLADTMLFDPYDWKDMAEKIEYGLKNTEELYQKELPLYRELEKRTGDAVAEEYIKAFQKFIEMDRAERERADRSA